MRYYCPRCGKAIDYVKVDIEILFSDGSKKVVKFEVDIGEQFQDDEIEEQFLAWCESNGYNENDVNWDYYSG